MNELLTFLNHAVVIKWGWVLLHFLWQGLLVSFVAWGLLVATAGKSARLRYLLATGCLFLTVLCPLVTWFSLEQPLDAVEVRNENMDSSIPARSTVSHNVAQHAPITMESDWESSVDESFRDVSTIPANSTSPTSSEFPPEWSWKTYLESSLPWIVSAWLLGVLILSLRLAGGWFVARRCVSRGVPLREEWALRVPGFIDRLKLNRSIRWIESCRIRVPQVMGWLKPVVLVPSSMFTTLSPEEIECLLLHELVHIRRYDYLVNLIQCVIETLFFYHPGVRWLSRRIRLERELACDEAVVSLTEDQLTFSRALLSLADLAQLPQPTLAATEGDLTTRIRAVMGMKRQGSLVGVAVWLCLSVCVLTLGVLFVPDSQASSQRDRPVDTEEKDRDASATNKRDEDGGDESSFAHLLGQVIDNEGNPVAGADVHTSLAGEKYSSISGSNGEFSLDVPRPEPLRHPRSLLVFAEMDKGSLQGTAFIPFDIKEDQQPEPTEITLQPPREFGVIVRDIAGEPVSGVTVRLMSYSGKLEEKTSDAQGRALLVVPADMPLRSIVAFKKGVGIDYEEFDLRGKTNVSLYSKNAENPVQFTLQPSRPVTVHVVDNQQQPVPGARVSFPLVRGIPGFSGLSDDSGNITFDMVPWNVSGAHPIGVYKEGYIDMKSTYFHPEAATWEVTAELAPSILVKGQVTMPDGRPVADAEVRARGENYNGPNPELIDLGRTNADGRFEFQVRPMMFYSFMAWKGDFISPAKELIIYKEAPAEPLRLQFEPAMRVRGQMTLGEGREPFAEQQIGFERQLQQTYSELAGDRELPDPYRNGSLYSLNPTHHWWTKTDAQGRFEVMLGPGEYRLNSPGNKSYEFNVEDRGQLELDVHFPIDSRRTTPGSIVLRPDDGVPLAGRVVSKADPDRGVPNLRILTYPRNSYSTVNVLTDAEGVFACQRAPEGTSYVYVATQDYKQAAMKAVKPEEQTVTLSIEPWVSITGRLIDAQTGQPLGDENIRCAVEYETGLDSIPSGTILSRTTKTQSDGTFMIGGLLPDCEHVIRADRVRAQGRREESVWVRVGQVTPKAGDEPVNVGDLKFETHRPASSADEPVPDQTSNDKQDAAEQKAAIIIIAEPKSSRPFEWKVGEKVTVGVRCVSDESTRVIGIATDVELAAAKDFDNRVQMALRTTPETVERIRKAAKISEYWFEIMPFREAHRQSLTGDVKLSEFLKNNPDFRPVDSKDWGYGAPGGRLKAPAIDELPNRK